MQANEEFLRGGGDGSRKPLCKLTSYKSYRINIFLLPFLSIIFNSVVEPEPDFLAGTGAGENEPAPGYCCVT